MNEKILPNEGKDRHDYTEVLNELDKLEGFRQQRADIALSTARYITESHGGVAPDLQLYYAAMFGRSYEEGVYENDKNLTVPLELIHKLTDPKQEGQPLLIRAVQYPESNVDIGVVASFSEENFEPIKLEVSMEEGVDDFSLWRGGLAIAMRKVVPKPGGNSEEYTLSEEISKITVCDTTTWRNRSGDGLEIHPDGTGGVEVGPVVHLNSKFGKKYHDKLAFWLREHLAPTDRLELDDISLRFKENIRSSRVETALSEGISEAEIAARSLSPTIASFFRTLESYAGNEEPEPIDIQAVFNGWRRDAYDAQSLFAELEIRDLVEEKEGRIVISKIGRAALSLIMEDRYE